MTWDIFPDNYDVVVIGSGLPECLIAASLVKSGKTVLIIDAVDTYGTDFASLTPAALQDFLATAQQNHSHLDNVPCADAVAPSGAAPASPAEHPIQQGEHEHSMPACSPVSGELPPNSRLIRLCQRALPLTGIRMMSVPAEEGGDPGILTDRRRYILDLAPKLVYQAEELVDLLVRCRCHHYLEFKAMEGCYILQDGALQPVPAGRADIFRDRRLSLADKRVLMRFIQGCVEARSGQGHLKEALAGSLPLAHVLRSEGLPPRLREVILYGIAMCDTDQEPPLTAAAMETVAQPAAAAAAGLGEAVGLMTGAAGSAALELFTGSQGRFGQEGVFMVPCYGSGSMAEAFVRLCAVHGAVTVLRQPVQALLVGKGGAAGPGEGSAKEVGATQSQAEAAEEEATEAAAGAAKSGAAAVRAEAVQATDSAAEARTGDPGPARQPEGEAAQAPEASGAGPGTTGAGPGAACQPSPSDGSGGAGGPDAEAEGRESCVGIVTAGGQVVRCHTVVAGVSTLSCLEGAGTATLPSAAQYVSRAVVVLDGPLLRGPATAPAPPPDGSAAPQRPPGVRPPSLMTLVVPPRCPGVAGGSNPHAVRALQQGASTCVCPAGRFLLYLSTPATSASSYEDLRPTLDLLVDTSRLRDVSRTSGAAPASAPNAQAATPEAAGHQGDPSAPAPQATSSGPDTAGGATDTPKAASGIADGSGGDATTSTARPLALQAWFYRQPVLHRVCSASEGGDGLAGPGLRLPAGVVALPGADGSLAGYGAVLKASEVVCRAAFSTATWLAEADFTPPAAEGDEDVGGDRGGGGGAADDDEDAIDELSAALARLKDASE